MSDDNDNVTYRVVRYRFKDESKTIKSGLTLEEAQEHCNSEDSHGEGWFDGYTAE